MAWRVAVDVVVVGHFLFILFVVGGGFLTWRWPRLAWVHVPVAIWGAVIEFVGFTCPLTPLEKWLRAKAGLRRYEGGFIEHYLVQVVYPPGLTPAVQVLLGVVVVTLNAIAYAHLRRRSPHP